MNHLIVVAHPAENSFTMGVARAYVGELQRLGHEARTFDRYRAKFEPSLTADELAPSSNGRARDAHIAQAQDDVRAAQVLTVIYPLWWLSMPAIMKGYIDRVFARGFAYESANGIVRGLLMGKKCVLITISGAPLSLLLKSGNWDAVQILQDMHIFRASGFELVEHLHFDGITPDLPRTIADMHLAKARSCAHEHFPAP